MASFFAGLVFFLLTALALPAFCSFAILGWWPWTVACSTPPTPLQFTRFYNDAFILANCAAWPLAAPAMVGWIIGGRGFAQLFANRARL